MLLGRRQLHQLSRPSCQDVLLASCAAVRAVVLTTICFSSFCHQPFGSGARGSELPVSVSSVSAAAMHRTVQGNRAPLRAELSASDRNKPLSCPIFSPVLLVVPWRACCSARGVILVGRDLWGSSKSSVSQLGLLTLGKLFTAFTEVLDESNWCLGWEEDGEMGRTVPSSSDQLDLLNCFGEQCSAGSFFVTENWTGFFQPLTWQTKEGTGGKGI